MTPKHSTVKPSAVKPKRSSARLAAISSDEKRRPLALKPKRSSARLTAIISDRKRRPIAAKPKQSSERLTAITSDKKRRRLQEKSQLVGSAECDEKKVVEESTIALLNDDCLLAMLSYLPIVDLFAVRRCCRRLKELADVVVPKQCKKETFHFNWKDKAHEDFLNRYGELIQNIVFDRAPASTHLKQQFDSDKPVVGLRQCKALKTLTFRNMPLVYDPSSAETFASLESLTIEDCTGAEENFETIIAACTNLKAIKIHNGPFNLNWMEARANLERISIRVNQLHCFLFVRFSIELKRLNYLFLDIPRCEYFPILVRTLPQSSSLEHLVLAIKSGVTLTPLLMLADALDRIETLKVCEIRYYRRQNDGYSVASYLIDAIKDFHVAISYRDCQSSDDNHYDIRLHRKN